MAEKNSKTQLTKTEVSTDSKTAPADALDLLSKVEGFYNNAFRKLVAVLGIGLLIVGIVIPLVLEYERQKSFAKEMAILRDELQKTTETRIESAIKILEKKQLKLIQENSKKQMQALNPTIALFGIKVLEDKDWPNGIKLLLVAVSGSLDYDDFELSVIMLNAIKETIQQQPRWYKDNDDYNTIVDAVIRIEKQNAEIDADTGCDDIIQEIKALVIKPPD